MSNEIIKKDSEAEVVKPKHPGGRPLKYKTPEEMQEEIDWYFKTCQEGVISTDEFGEVIYNKDGSPARVGQKPPTVTGLALALGFTSRTDLLRYEAKDEFYSTIQKAKMLIEEYAEARLFDRDGVNGAKFSLANNFKGWKEDRSLDITVNAGQQQAEGVATLRDLQQKRLKEENKEILGEVVDLETPD